MLRVFDINAEEGVGSFFSPDSAMKNVGMDKFSADSDLRENRPMDVIWSNRSANCECVLQLHPVNAAVHTSLDWTHDISCHSPFFATQSPEAASKTDYH